MDLTDRLRAPVSADDAVSVVQLKAAAEMAADEIERLRAALVPFANVPTHGLDGGPLACASIGYEDGSEGVDLPHSPTWQGRLPHEAFTAARRALRRDI